MTKHDELVALLTEIRDRLPERPVTMRIGGREFAAKVSPAPDDDATNARYEREDAEARQDEPVEPGDLRAGDRVALTWEGERIACTLEGHQDGNVLRSGTPDKDDYYPNVVVQGKWCSAISDVRLIERAPREDSDERIRVYVEMVERAEKAERRVDELEPALARSETERDEWEEAAYRWKAKHAALRADVDEFQYKHRTYPGTWELVDALGHDAARAPQPDPDAVTLPREVLEQAVRVWGEARGHAETLDAYRTARAALGWGDSDD